MVEWNHTLPSMTASFSLGLLDETFMAGRAVGATGTPSAVLIDAQGRIASPLTIGAPAVHALLADSDASPHPPSRTVRLAQPAAGERNGALVR